MKWDWIFFDADETLFTFDSFSGLQRMFLDYSVTFTAEDFQDYQAVNKPLWVDYQNGAITSLQLQRQRFVGWGEQLNVPPEELNDAFMNAMAEICAPLPGAASLISALEGKVKMGIITNGFTSLQQIRLERTGFRDHFDLLIISEEVGVAKPDARIFDYALAQAGIQLYPGASGNADEQVKALLENTLEYDPNTMCQHHDHGEGHTCGEHGCGNHA